jgi:hypothetical protein
MEKRIEEKYSGAWRMVWLFVAIPIGLMLIAPFGSWIVGNGFTHVLLPSAVGLVCIFFIIGFVQWLSKGQKTTWFLTKDGLQQVASGERTAIAWEQIQDMKWNGFIGLTVRWNESDQKEKTVYEEHRSLLGVGQNEARELMSLWQEKKAATPTQSYKNSKVRNRRDAVGAGKLFLAGFLALICVVVEIHSKKWIMAASGGFVASGAIALGIWFSVGATKGHVKSRKNSFAVLFALFLLVVFVLCLALIQSKNGK